MAVVTVRVPDWLAPLIRKHAAARGMSLSQYYLLALSELMDRDEADATCEPLRNRLDRVYGTKKGTDS